jgi:hypothetical protein
LRRLLSIHESQENSTPETPDALADPPGARCRCGWSRSMGSPGNRGFPNVYGHPRSALIRSNPARSARDWRTPGAHRTDRGVRGCCLRVLAADRHEHSARGRQVLLSFPSGALSRSSRQSGDQGRNLPTRPPPPSPSLRTSFICP